MLRFPSRRGRAALLAPALAAMCWLVPARVHSQSIQDLVRKVERYCTLISEREPSHDADSLAALNDSLLTYLSHELPRIPDGVTAPISLIGNRVHVTTSADGKVRIWSWLNGLGKPLQGRKREYFALVQYRSGSDVRTQVLRWAQPNEDSTDFTGLICDSIFAAQTHSRGGDAFMTYFLVLRFPSRTDLVTNMIEADVLRNDGLHYAPKTFDEFMRAKPKDKDKEHGTIVLSYHSIDGRTTSRITFSPTGYVLTIPDVDSNFHLQPTSSRYELDGDTYFHTGIAYDVRPGRSLQDIEKQLARADADIDRFNDSVHHNLDFDDSVANVTAYLSDYLKATLPLLPETMHADLKIPSYLVASYQDRRVHNVAMVTLASSADHNIRVWTWNTWTGGSMPCLENIVEYRTPRDIRVVDLERDLGWSMRDFGSNHLFDTIYNMRAANGRTIYLLRETWITDGRHSGRGLFAFGIDDSVLNTDLQVFPNIDDTTHRYDSGIGASCEDCDLPHIKVDAEHGKVYIQQTGSNDDKPEELQPAWDVYTFDGTHFVPSGEERWFNSPKKDKKR